MSGPTVAGRVLAVRLDSDGDVLLTGPAVRALGTGADGAPREVDLLVSPAGRAAGELLPGVAQVRTFAAPWSGYEPPALDAGAVEDLLGWMRGRAHEECVVFTSFHQSPLPMALLARLAGVPRVAGTSEDYPGSLLDVRHRRGGGADGSGGGHEVRAALDLVAATGRAVGADSALSAPNGPSAPSGEPRLAVRAPGPPPSWLQDLLEEDPAPGPVVALHAGASVPARAPAPDVAAASAAALATAGFRVLLTGSPAERELVAGVLARARRELPEALHDRLHDLAGRTDLEGLAGVLRRVDAVVVGNTGPAHLAAAVGTPVVSWFSPVVPAERWAPWGVPTVLLGDQQAPCALSRARECPVAGHPCLAVDPGTVVEAVRSVVGVVPEAGDDTARDTAHRGGDHVEEVRP